MRLAILLGAGLAFAGCSGFDQSLPDGGRRLLSCNKSSQKAPVVVLDRAGAPASDATVRAVNTYDGRNVALTTDGNGAAQISSELGPGVVRVTASLNDLSATPGELTFVCGDCDCSVTPQLLTLQLR